MRAFQCYLRTLIWASVCVSAMNCPALRHRDSDRRGPHRRPRSRTPLSPFWNSSAGRRASGTPPCALWHSMFAPTPTNLPRTGLISGDDEWWTDFDGAAEILRTKSGPVDWQWRPAFGSSMHGLRAVWCGINEPRSHYSCGLPPSVSRHRCGSVQMPKCGQQRRPPSPDTVRGSAVLAATSAPIGA